MRRGPSGVATRVLPTKHTGTAAPASTKGAGSIALPPATSSASEPGFAGGDGLEGNTPDVAFVGFVPAPSRSSTRCACSAAFFRTESPNA